MEYAYDSFGRLLEERQNGRAVSSRYGASGRRVQVTYPGGRVLREEHDALDRVKRVLDGGAGALVASYDWVGPGLRPLRRVHGDGSLLTFLSDPGEEHGGYDAVQRVVRQRVRSGNAPIVERDYEYGRAGQRTLERRNDDAGLTDQFFYDSAYRLVRSTFDRDGEQGAPRRAVSELSYELDRVGNRVVVNTATSAGTTRTTYTVNPLNQYTRVGPPAPPPPAAAPSPTHTYDGNGNLTSDGTATYHYDYRDRLVRVLKLGLDDSRVITFRYLPDGRRAAKTVQAGPGAPANTTEYLYDGAQEVEERDASGQVQATFVWSPTYVDDLVQYQRGGATYYAHSDARGNVVAVTDAMGRIVERIRYDDFGNMEIRDSTGQVVPRSTVGLEYGFQGRRHDPETGLIYFRARYYDPQTGRFISRDPVWDPTNLGNPYTFVGNNPVTLTDPSGQAWFLPALYMGAKWAAMAAVGVLAADVGVQHYTGHADQGFNWTGDQYGSPGALQISGTAAAYGFVGGFTFGVGTAGFGALGASPLAAEMLAGPLSVGAMDLARGEVSHPGWYAAGFAAPAVIRGAIGGAARLRSGGGGPDTGVAAFDELATGATQATRRRFQRWKANVERRGWTVTARELEAGERAFVEVTQAGERHLVYDPRHFRYIDLLHESRHIRQIERAEAAGVSWGNKAAKARFEQGAYNYEVRLGARMGFSPEYQAWAQQRGFDYITPSVAKKIQFDRRLRGLWR